MSKPAAGLAAQAGSAAVPEYMMAFVLRQFPVLTIRLLLLYVVGNFRCEFGVVNQQSNFCIEVCGTRVKIEGANVYARIIIDYAFGV